MAWKTYDTINTEQANGNILRTYFGLVLCLFLVFRKMKGI